jgi:hypothetical protein
MRGDCTDGGTTVGGRRRSKPAAWACCSVCHPLQCISQHL